MALHTIQGSSSDVISPNQSPELQTLCPTAHLTLLVGCPTIIWNITSKTKLRIFYRKPVPPRMLQISANSVIKILDIILVSFLCNEKKEKFMTYLMSACQSIFWVKWALVASISQSFLMLNEHIVKGSASLSCWMEILSECSCNSGSYCLKGRGPYVPTRITEKREKMVESHQFRIWHLLHMPVFCTHIETLFKMNCSAVF